MEKRLTVPDVLPMVVTFLGKPENRAGGTLHAWLDDGNIDDASIEWCRNYALEKGDLDGEAIASLALRLTRTQRLKLAREACIRAGF